MICKNCGLKTDSNYNKCRNCNNVLEVDKGKKEKPMYRFIMLFLIIIESIILIYSMVINYNNLFLNIVIFLSVFTFISILIINKIKGKI